MRSFLAALILVGAFALPAAAQSASNNSASLYKRIGGYDAIVAVTDDFIIRLATDRQLSKFFMGKSKDSEMKLRQFRVPPTEQKELLDIISTLKKDIVEES